VVISHPILTTIPQQKKKKSKALANTYSLMFHLDKSHVLSTYESLSMGSLIGWTGEPSHNGRGLLNVG